METNDLQKQRIKENIDLKKTLSMIFSHWYLFLIGLIIAGACAWLVNRYTTPVYMLKSSLLVKEQQESSPFTTSAAPISNHALEGFGLSGGSSNLHNQTEIIKSRPIVRKALEELNFEVSHFIQGNIIKSEIYLGVPYTVYWEKDHPQLVNLDFIVKLVNDSIVRVEAIGENIRVHDYQTGEDIRMLPTVLINKTAGMGERIAGDHYAFRIIFKENYIPAESNDNVFSFNTKKQLENNYRSRLSVSIEGEYTSIISLNLKDFNPAKGIDFLNKLMQVYQDDNLEQKNEYANRTIDFINSQLSDISDSLMVSEQELLTFQSDNKVVDLTVQAEQLLTLLSDLDNERAALEAQNRYYSYLRTYIMENQDLESIMAPSSLGVDDPVLTSLIVEINTLTIEKSKLGNVRESPRLTQLNAQIEKIKNAMLENINDIINQGDLNLSSLNKRIWQTEGLVRKLPATERNLVNIERKYNLNSETYTFLLEKITEAQIAKASNVPDSQVIEEASYELQIEPKTATIYALALSLGLIIPLLLLFLRDFFNTRVVSQEDVEDLTGLPILGHVFINRDTKNRNTPVIDRPESKDSEPFRGLRNKLNLMTRGKEKPVIAVTSTAPKEGKSYTAINLAASFALLNKKALLLDLDLRNSVISSTLGIESNTGVVNYIMGDAKLNEITYNIKHPDFFVIPAGPIPPNPGEMLMDTRLVQLLDELKDKYDVIVIDSAPVGYVSDLFQITDLLDATIFVVRDRITRLNWLKNAIRELETHKLKGVGIVINGVKRKKNKYKSYGYGYGYGYGAKNGKGKSKRKKLS